MAQLSYNKCNEVIKGRESVFFIFYRTSSATGSPTKQLDFLDKYRALFGKRRCRRVERTKGFSNLVALFQK